ncbi:MAG TPA: hypothetical protein VIO58_10190 [Candidatus Methanoperedens sp.]
MKNKPLATPVLFLIFNRPETTQRVFEEIRKVKPAKLFVSADGPRENKIGEAEKCRAARDIIRQVDWECEIHKNFHENNLGLKLAMSSAIDWFFDNVEEGIILEDDCLPNQSFFWFCQELLEKYRDDERIMAISGDNFQSENKRGQASYYFSKVVGVWGWASWKRAWSHFDLDLKSFPEFKAQHQIKNVFEDELSRTFWMTKIQEVYDGGDSWAFPWIYSILSQNGLCITPNVNLVSNIGHGSTAVHSVDTNSIFANIGTAKINEIKHPEFILPNKDADKFYSKVLASEQLPHGINRIQVTMMAFAKKVIPATYHKKIGALIGTKKNY